VSDDKPFAEAMTKEEDGYPVKIHGAAEYYCASKNSAYLDAHNITAKATARERKAAAQALREAADAADHYESDAMELLGHHDGTLADSTRLRVSKWLRARADAIEKGKP
jgi:hypothetical protein